MALTILTSPKGKQYYKNLIYPEIPPSENDTYIITTVGDRLDLLSDQFYNDVQYWRVISFVNNNITKGSLYPIPGTQLRIPADINAVNDAINQLNS